MNDRPCYMCQGKGFIVMPPYRGKPTLTRIPCYLCGGRGSLKGRKPNV